MILDLITPSEKIFSGEVSSVSFPGTDGHFQVLKGHAPMISTLTNGTVKIKDEKGEHKIMIGGGVMEILNDKITLLADSVLKNS